MEWVSRYSKSFKSVHVGLDPIEPMTKGAYEAAAETLRDSYENVGRPYRSILFSVWEESRLLPDVFVERESDVDALEMIMQVRQNINPSEWQIFRGEKHHINDRLEVTKDDLPLLIITSDKVVEYIHAHLPVTVLSFKDFKDIYLRIIEKELQEGVTIVLIDLRFTTLDNKWTYWSPEPNFEDDEVLILQRVIEAFARYPLLSRHKDIH